jgi:Na+/H+-dicarboxylate symporter
LLINIFSDRFRTTINVFGDSIGCAIVQHLSRKELSALDNEAMAIASVNSNTVLPLLVPGVEHGTNIPNGTRVHPASHVIPMTYDNPTFVNQS